ncbi:MAG: alpha-galactosidase [Bacilli bacterium]|nr:alpha-galactosidase [Bacilli bacterium]
MKLELKYSYSGKDYSVDIHGDSRVSFDINQDDNHILINLVNKLPIIIKHFSFEIEKSFENVKQVYLNGWQSWSTSRLYNLDEHVGKVGLLGLLANHHFGVKNYGDYNFVKYSKLYSHLYTYLVNQDDTIYLIGSKNEVSGFSIIRLFPNESKIIFEKDIDNVSIFGKYELASVEMHEGNPEDVFDKFFGKRIDAKTNGKLLKGYTSWYRHYQNIDEAKINNDLKGFEESKIDFNVFQIDDGYQQAVGDWLKIDKRKFPNGLEKIASRINKDNLTAGIWLAPFVAETTSDIYKLHKDWFCLDKKGHPLRAGGNWSGFYCLDVYNKDVREYLTKVFRHFQLMGFKFFKLDFLYAVCLAKREDKSRGQVMNEAMDFLREVLKDSLILGCGLPLGAAFGKVDYMRIGPDVTLSWNDKWFMHHINNERPSTLNAINNTIARYHLDGRVFYNDPDVFVLRNSEDVSLTDDQKLKLFDANTKFGSVLFTSDDIALYTDNENKIIQKLKNL